MMKRNTVIVGLLALLMVFSFAGFAMAEEQAVHTNDFDLESGTVLLNNGVEMPIIGIGTYALTEEEAENSIYNMLVDGGRLIDTAAAYHTEEAVGRAVRRAIDEGIVTREEVFVTTKLWPDHYDDAGVDLALEKLDLDYIDLLLLHQPMGDYVEGYKALERAYRDGKVRAIGLSNFYGRFFEEAIAGAEVMPAVLQVETHLHNQQVDTMAYLDQYGTVLEAWFPLGGRGNTQVYLNDPTVVAIAQAHNVSAAQVILRWHLQSNHVAIPGSANPDHIREDLDLFGFELTNEEMDALKALDEGSPYYSFDR